MKIPEYLKVRKAAIVKVEERLNELDDKLIFPEKLEKANEMLKEVGIPKQWVKKLG